MMSSCAIARKKTGNADMIDADQLRAARALLDWKTADLARLSDVTVNAINNIERKVAQGRKETLEKIQRVFEDAGLEFIPGGVHKVRDAIVRLEGVEGFKTFLDDVYEIAKRPYSRKGGDKPICIGHVDDRYFAESLGDFFAAHLERMNALSDLKMKILVYGKPYTLSEREKLKSGYREYKQSSLQLEGNVPFYVYGNKLAILIFEKKTPVQIVVISSELISKAYRAQFDMLWKVATPLNVSEIGVDL
jgi:transcriptional regulator with XRE-family HTH domain